jgi:preprotein translocase subunit YajC
MNDPNTYSKVQSSDNSHYGILLICLWIIVMMWYINRKLQESRKKHIL